MDSKNLIRFWSLAAFLIGQTIAVAENDSSKLLTGKAAMGDWSSDAPGVRRKIIVADLPPPGSNVLAINFPRVVARPADAQLRVPSGFKIDMYANDFRDPRFLLIAPNGDVFIVESRANQIKIARGTDRAESVQAVIELGNRKDRARKQASSQPTKQQMTPG